MAEKTEKKRKIKSVLFCCAVGLVVLILYVAVSIRPLDEMTEYQVHVAPRDDGSLDITYRFKWKVLNDSKEGPLTWVKLGMANPQYMVGEMGGAAAGIRYQPSEFSQNSMLELNLNRPYYKGETASFWVTVHQQNMLCKSIYDPEKPFYDFTPGWFDQINVIHYEFTWEQRRNIISHNADRIEDGNLVWEGALKKGESRQMTLTCALEGFRHPKLVEWKPYQNSVKGDSPVSGSIVLVILTVTFCAAFNAGGGFDQNSYEGGRGYHRYHGIHGGGGGSCACACAGCACACACAGGGRAGCSKKDFYHNTPKNF